MCGWVGIEERKRGEREREGGGNMDAQAFTRIASICLAKYIILSQSLLHLIGGGDRQERAVKVLQVSTRLFVLRFSQAVRRSAA